MRDHMKVDTPFDIDRFEAMLANHSNQPFVESAMTGLREGFWPLDEGEWKIEPEEFTGNYEDHDLDTHLIERKRVGFLPSTSIHLLTSLIAFNDLICHIHYATDLTS
ncbi:hypothetical protein Hypma_013712 [Hypsizygus marmoreus]|uniref:Uncharacterized protein n=1 Tax=Hypsizygus marmoreus TaxID=39966 RepID=A0A369JI76_HYPMA|nr:hypothetical protein Hypma_013712 [Hypsizygus marmoreus]